MAKNEVYRVGQYIPAPVPDIAPGTARTTVDLRKTSGVPLRLGDLNVVTVSQKGETQYPGNASVDTGGAHLLLLTVTNGPITFGTKVYLTTATGVLANASAGGTFFGWFIGDGPLATGVDLPAVIKIANAG